MVETNTVKLAKAVLEHQLSDTQNQDEEGWICCNFCESKEDDIRYWRNRPKNVERKIIHQADCPVIIARVELRKALERSED